MDVLTSADIMSSTSQGFSKFVIFPTVGNLLTPVPTSISARASVSFVFPALDTDCK